MTWLSAVRRRRRPANDPGLIVQDDGFHSVRPGRDSQLIGLDENGNIRHTLNRLALLFCLSDGTLIAAAPDALVRIDDPARAPQRRVALSNLRGVYVLAERIVAETESRFVVLSHALDHLSDFPTPRFSTFTAGRDGIYWCADGDIRRSDWSGVVSHIAFIPAGLVRDELRRECPELAADKARPDYCELFARIGWVITPDADERYFFACNRLAGFTVVCFERSGLPRWARCLSYGCCGYRVQPLSNGTFVASSGCGGTVSWLNADGNVLSQSAPLLGPPLTGAIWSNLLIGDDDSVYVDRGGSLISYDALGRPRWEIALQHISRAQLDRPRNRLLCAHEIRGRFGRSWSHLDAWALHS